MTLSSLRYSRFLANLTTVALVVTPLVFLSGSERAEAESVVSQLGKDIDGEAAGDYSGYSVSLNSDGTIVAIGAQNNDGTASEAGHVRVYQYNSGTWRQLGSDIDGEAAGDRNGVSVSLNSDGNRVAIGAYYNDDSASQAGHVRVYEYDSDTDRWSQLGSDIDGRAAYDYTGRSVSLNSDGTIVAIGEPQQDPNRGRVRVYQYDSGSGWVQLGSDIGGEGVGDQSGLSVSLNSDGTRVAIGATLNDGAASNAGHVRVYQYDSGSGWVQLGGDIDGEAANDYSGQSVSLNSDGTIVAIGAIGNDATGADAGHVRVYQYTSGTWSQLGSDIDGEATNDYSGQSVSLNSDGTRVAVGAIYNDGSASNAGHVRVYDWSGTSWQQIVADIDGEARNDFSGQSVSLSSSGQALAIGAYGNSSFKGHVRVFSLPSIATSTSSPVQSGASVPGIFLTVHGSASFSSAGIRIRFGAFSIQRTSPYVVTIRQGNDFESQRVIDSGSVSAGGHFDHTMVLPGLSAGTHTVIFTAYNTAGQQLSLGNVITVDSTGTIVGVTPEDRQPWIR